jgi:hypothetical protein
MLVTMDIATALGVLGLNHEADWTEVRAVHRAAIRHSHPDAGGSTDRAAQINQAFALLEQVTNGGRNPLPPPTPAKKSSGPPNEGSPATVFGTDSPAELVLLLADVGHDVGEVVSVDPQSCLLEIIVGSEPGVAQLTVAVGERTKDGISVAFTLKSLGVAAPPPIGEVVNDLLQRHYARQER